MKVTTWIMYWSSVVDAAKVALVAPFASTPSATMRSESKPSPLTKAGTRWLIVSVPSKETELLKRFVRRRPSGSGSARTTPERCNRSSTSGATESRPRP